ncbi:MAG: polymer-forming cytoskeletal protein [Patescibacteria group bacterium]
MACPRSIAALLLATLLVPASASAATFATARTLVLSEPVTENVYVAGTDITVATGLPLDMLAAGGTIRIAAPVAGDLVLAGGTIAVERPVGGDLRAAGGRVIVSGPVAGDLVLAGGTVTASSTASDTRIIGGTVNVTGSGGRAVVYGAEVYLSGTFQGDVEIIASDRLTLAEGTVITGSLRYDAPQEVSLPASASVTGGVVYTGSSSYLPTVEEARTFALAGASVFVLVRLLSVLILAGLLAGLFPVFTQRVADKALTRTPGRFALLALLGFAVVVATPVFVLLLMLSFVGMGVGALLLIAYLLLLALGYVYAGVLAGSALGRGLLKRPSVTWKIALLGMLALYLVGAVPVIGDLLVFVLFLAATGSIVAIAHRFAFGRFSADDADEPLTISEKSA